MGTKGVLKICNRGHNFYKSSNCPTCPICEKERKPASGFLSLVPAPARRALEHTKIKTLHQLSRRSETEILKLHGMGPAAMPKLRAALQSKGLSFRKR